MRDGKQRRAQRAKRLMALQVVIERTVGGDTVQPRLTPIAIGRDKAHPYFQTTLRTIMQTDMGQMRPADFANDGQPQP